MSLLIVTGILFVGSHLLLSHPLRAPLADRMGERAFQIVYSVVAVATLILVVQAWRGMPPEPPLWVVDDPLWRSEEHTSELQSLMRISYAVFCLKKKNIKTNTTCVLCDVRSTNSKQDTH